MTGYGAWPWVAGIALTLMSPASLAGAPSVSSAARSTYGLSPPQIRALAPALERAVRIERQASGSPSVGLAVFTDTGMVIDYSAGFADKDSRIPADAATVFRAGSVTKPLTELVMMRLVDRGVLDLDVPVQRYLPDFKPKNPFGTAITLRMLATHRAGLVREPPAGSYFATHAPDLATVVRSLNETRLLAKPGTVTKYSNAGVTVIGRVLEVVTGKSYPVLMRDELFAPAHMLSSSVRLEDSPRPIAYAEMQSYGAPRFPAPVFETGLQPAGALNTTLRDLSALGSVLLADGKTPDGRQLISREALAQMERSQTPQPDENGSRFAIGFAVGDLEGHPLIEHDGAIYGFVTDFALLPQDGIGVVAYSTVDAGSSAIRLAYSALLSALAVRSGKDLPLFPTSWPLSVEEAKALVGVYRHGHDTVTIRWLNGTAYIETPHLAGRLRRGAPGFVLDDYFIPLELAIDPRGRWLFADGTRYVRTIPPPPPAAPPEMIGLIGDYGWDHEVVRVFERDGGLFVRIEWVEYNRMTRETADVWKFPVSSALYPGEALVFKRDAHGAAVSVSLNGIVFPRRRIARDGLVAHLDRLQQEQLRTQALRATPPVERGPHRRADLVPVDQVDPTIKLDIRYATSNNLLGFPAYSRASGYLQRPVAEALARADKKLHRLGYGIVFFDGYRPWYVTRMFWDATPPEKRIFVADPAQGSRHNRGAAVDIGLVDATTGRELQMTGQFDEMSSRSYPLYDGGTSVERRRRDLLRSVMESEGFSVYDYEWWHFDFHGWQQFPIMNVDFSQLDRERTAPSVPAKETSRN